MTFTETALVEIESILDGTLAYGGADHTRRVRARLERLFSYLDEGVGLGTPRPELGLSDDIRFVSTAPYPFIVVYDRRESLVLRVVHARSNYREMVMTDWSPAS